MREGEAVVSRDDSDGPCSERILINQNGVGLWTTVSSDLLRPAACFGAAATSAQGHSGRAAVLQCDHCCDRELVLLCELLVLFELV